MDAFERNPEAVEQDVINGYVSVAGARDDYGVVIDPNSLKINPEATKNLRASINR